ncbi:MAG TPA: hypothetical protein VJZ32_06570 [Candidatus Bathyarchaeia archaeon]|nr:hypothetical protein [Candidatus Bathyarchaeia archaeon]
MLSTRLSRTIGGLALTVILSLSYVFIITPIGWRKRKDKRSEVSLWKVPDARTGWHLNEQSTTNTETYRVMSSDRADLEKHAHNTRERWTLFIYDELVPLKFLAHPPKQKELRSDLYVMF